VATTPAIGFGGYPHIHRASVFYYHKHQGIAVLMKVLAKPFALVVVLPLLVALAGLVFVKFPVSLFMIVVIVMLALAWLITYLDLQIVYMKTLVLFLPFANEIPITADSMLYLPTEPMLVLAAILFLIDLLRKPSPVPIRLFKELLWFAPLILAFLITVPFSANGIISIKFAVINLLYIIVFFLYLYHLSQKKPALPMQLMLIYTLGLVVVSCWAIYQYWSWDWNPVVVRGIFSPFYKDHTIFAATSALVAIYWLTSFWLHRTNPGRWLELLTGIFCMLFVIISSSRAGFFSLFFAAMVFILLQLRIRLRTIGLGAGLLLVILLMNQQRIINSMQKVTAVSYDSHADLMDRVRSVGNITTDESNLERLNRWVAAWQMFKKKPLTGYGPGTYQYTYIPYQNPAFYNRLTVTNPWRIPENSGGTAHSEYLLALSEMGILGLLGWLLLLGRWFFMAFSKKNKGNQRNLMLIAFAALSTYIFHALFNNFLNIDKFAFLFWGMAAWLTLNYNLSNEKELLPKY
jgi:putative inorganic carbon (hco3(-)) transporter